MDANRRQHAGEAAPRPGTCLRLAILSAALVACAAHPRPAPNPPTPAVATRGNAAAPDCVVADTTAPTRDTLYVVGYTATDAGVAPSACERRAMAGAVPPVVVTEIPDGSADLRDVLDRGLPATHEPRPDVVVTRDPDVLAYASAGGTYTVATLPWSRTYTLMSDDSAAAVPPEPERDALARDAVTVDARGAAAPFAWLADAACTAPLGAPSAAPPPIVAYAAGDMIARQLAERIVALAAARARPEWLPAGLARGVPSARVAPVEPDSIAAALASGRAAAAVVALARDERAPCGMAGAPLRAHAVPLVDSRAHAIIRRGSGAAFTVAPDGTLRFVRRGTP